jgi:hypothetical protein
MGAVSTRVRAELRHRVRSAVVLALAIGIAAGATMAALAGARRTDTAVDRFVAYSHPGQGVVIADRASYPRIARLPQIEASTLGTRLALALTGEHAGEGALNEIGVDDLDFSRPIILAGRTPNPERSDEVVINSAAAEHVHMRVGSLLRFRAFGPEQAQELLRGTNAPPTGPSVTVRVVGIVRFPADLSVAPPTPDVTYTGNDAMFFTRAFVEKYRDRIALVGGTILVFRLRGGQSAYASFQATVDRLTGGKAFVAPGSDDLAAAVQARHATRVEALALLLFGLLAGVITAALIAQAFARQVFLESDEYPALRAMGMTRAQIVSVAAIRAAFVSCAGAALAVALAIAVSPRLPIGLARQAEVDPGISVDGGVLAIGALTIIVLFTAWTALTAWRVAANATTDRRVTRRTRASRLAGALNGAGSPPSATVGAAMALESGRGSSAIPARTALVSAALAVTAVTGALTFGVNLARVADRPRLQGWNWDVAVGNPHSDDVSKTAIPRLSRNPAVAAFTAIAGGDGGIEARINGEDAGLFGIDVVKGPGLVEYPAGRAPRTASEIAFGTKTMRAHHLAIGDRVKVSTGGPVRSLRITGRVLLTPSVVNNSVALGDAAVVSGAALRALHADAPVNVFLVRFRPGIDRSAALTRLRTDFPGTVLPAVRPPDIENLQRVSNLPTVLALLFALVALVTISNTLVSAVRRRRRDLAVLRTLGFVRRQVSAVVAWQATTVALIAIVIGLPLGAAAGRSIWTLVTDRLGLAPVALIPAELLLLLGAVALVAANLVAVIPGLLASRTAPASVLRTE